MALHRDRIVPNMGDSGAALASDPASASASPGGVSIEHDPTGTDPGEVTPLTGSRYVPGFDGLRALAVAAVLLFHGGVGWLHGGLLGVDIFFVLSGFLITSLLISEFRASGTISFKAFYARRARRLLPALFVTVLGVSAYAVWIAPTSVRAAVRGDGLSTLTEVANWHFIVTNQNYFVRNGPPSPLLHTWSLAVEEQFYLVWPALALVVMRRWRDRGLLIVAVLLAMASAVWCAFEFHHGAGATRLYYGTDVRVQEVMVGASLAALWIGASGGTARPDRTRLGRRGLAVLGLGGLAVLVWCLHQVNGASGFLYQGGFLVVSLSTLAVLAAVVGAPGSLVERFFALAPLRYVGRISYGLYLYHWPIFLFLDGPRTGLTGTPLLLVRLAVSTAAAAVSYRFVELPLRGLRPRVNWRRVVILPGAASGVVALLVVATINVPSSATGEVDPGLRQPAPVANASAQPVRVLVLGDSVMVELSLGLVHDTELWGVNMTVKAALNCDLFSGTQIMESGSPTPQPEGCPDWRRTWAAEIAELDPDVVLIGVGRWELADRYDDGRWRNPGDPVMQRAMMRLLDEAITVGNSHGAHVVLSTSLYDNPDLVGDNGLPDPMDSSQRVDAYNALVYRVATHHTGVASVLDLNKLLCPQGHWTLMLHGIQVRDSDGIHPSPAGGQYIQRIALPLLARAGRSHLDARLAADHPATTTTATAP
jgi:peptidoglycan/LPS O-acetylase OafA/YrhL